MIVGVGFANEKGEALFPVFFNGRFQIHNDACDFVQDICRINYKDWFLWLLSNKKNECEDFFNYIEKIKNCTSFKSAIRVAGEENFHTLMNHYYESEAWK